MIDEWYVIANPAAGKGEVQANWSVIESQLMNALPIGGVVFSQSRGHAIELAKQAVESGHKKILAVGGDGTNHEVVNGILQQERFPSSEITYALLPIGTGNDWIKTHGLPQKTEEILKIIQAGNTAYQDIGSIQYTNGGKSKERYFVNVAGMAYDGYICEITVRDPSVLKNHMSYMWLVVKCLFKYKLRKANVNIDGENYSGKFYTINLGIGKYSGGGMQLVPHASPTAGQFAITLAGNLTKLGVLFNTYRFYNGSIGRHSKVTTLFGKKIEVVAAGDQATLVEADGEFLGETPVKFEILAAALKHIVP